MKEWRLIEALYNQRSIREYSDKPVRDEDIQFLLDTAVKAPSGGDRQPWAFLVIRDPAARRKMRDFYVAGFQIYCGSVLQLAEREGHPDVVRQAERMESKGSDIDTFQRNFEQAPLMIMILADERNTLAVHEDAPVLAMNSLYGSIYFAVQNILLACMSRDLGAVPTTLYARCENEVKAYLEIPDYYRTCMLIAIGHLKKGDAKARPGVRGVRYGPNRRHPAHLKTHWERFGEQKEWEPKTKA